MNAREKEREKINLCLINWGLCCLLSEKLCFDSLKRTQTSSWTRTEPNRDFKHNSDSDRTSKAAQQIYVCLHWVTTMTRSSASFSSFLHTSPYSLRQLQTHSGLLPSRHSRKKAVFEPPYRISGLSPAHCQLWRISSRGKKSGIRYGNGNNYWLLMLSRIRSSNGLETWKSFVCKTFSFCQRYANIPSLLSSPSNNKPR